MLKPGNAEFVIKNAGYKDLSKKMILDADTTFTLSLAPQINPKTKNQRYRTSKDCREN